MELSNMYKTNFDFIVERAKASLKPLRVAVAGADSENILQGIFDAVDAGFVEATLVGNEEKINVLLKRLKLADKPYTLVTENDENAVVQTSIDLIRSGKADGLLRGSTQTRDFLLPILDKKNGLVPTGNLLTHIALLKLPDYERLLAISDVTMLVRPNISERKQVVQNMVHTLNALGYDHPNIALLSLVETPAFHMPDTIESQTIVHDHQDTPIADCELIGPISYDLIISKEAARLKNYDCPLCGEFDGIVVPNLLTGNLLVKALQMHDHSTSCGVIVGATVPIAITSRSDSREKVFLSLAACAAIPVQSAE